MALCWADSGMLCDLDLDSPRWERRTSEITGPRTALRPPRHTAGTHLARDNIRGRFLPQTSHVWGETTTGRASLKPENIWPHSFHLASRSGAGGGKSEYSRTVNTDGLRELIVCSKHQQQRCIQSQLFGFCRIRFPLRN